MSGALGWQTSETENLVEQQALRLQHSSARLDAVAEPMQSVSASRLPCTKSVQPTICAHGGQGKKAAEGFCSFHCFVCGAVRFFFFSTG